MYGWRSTDATAGSLRLTDAGGSNGIEVDGFVFASPLSFNSSGTFPVPAGVSCIQVQAWGAGGDGANGVTGANGGRAGGGSGQDECS